jgi:glycosyltransferase involved in cell wall biosynthesis
VNQPRSSVSVIIPCYNVGRYLPEAMDSVRQQTYPPSELIVVDDGSTDQETLSLLDRYAGEGVQVLHTTNRGAPAARNHGINLATGDYVSCLDGDDVWLPTYLEETVARLDAQPDVGIVATYAQHFGDREGIWRLREYRPSLMLAGCQVPSCSLFRKTCWQEAGGYKDLQGFQDWELWISIVEERGWKWAVVPKPLYRYRQRPGSISEYREAHREKILHQLLTMHASVYKRSLPDVLVEVAAQIEGLRRGVGGGQRGQTAQATATLSHQESGGQNGTTEVAVALAQIPAHPAHRFVPAPHGEYHTFSIAIMTYNRAELLAKAIESALNQDYPKDRYELVIVDNGSTDETAQVVEHYRKASPVPISYHVETRRGVSYARNLGIEMSRLEYMAQLDDDEAAASDWLASINGIINKYHALVVGGRVELSFDEGCTPPAWFSYLTNPFGVNYGRRGDVEDVFRVRYPLYLSGGNTAYARRLFDHFGRFRTDLGRAGASLRGGEETFFNMVLDRNDIPLYYAQEVGVFHYVAPDRLKKRYLLRKAYWAGVTNAYVQLLVFGQEETGKKLEEYWAALWRRSRQVMDNRGDPENTSRVCNIAHLLGFLGKSYLAYAEQKLTGRTYAPPAVAWTQEDRLEEASRWPNSRLVDEQA